MFGILTASIVFFGFSYGEDVLTQIGVQFISTNLIGDVGNTTVDVIYYNDKVYVPFDDLMDVTGLETEWDYNQNGIKFKHYSLQVAAPDTITYRYDADNEYLYIYWNDTGADYYRLSIKSAGYPVYEYLTDNDGSPHNYLWYPEYCVRFVGVKSGGIDMLKIESVLNGVSSSPSDPIAINKNIISSTSDKQSITSNSINENQINTDKIETSTYDIISQKYSRSDIVMRIVSADKISNIADTNLFYQNLWIRTFENTLSDKSALTSGNYNTWAVSSALSAANAAME